MPLRTFLAVDIDDAVRRRLAAASGEIDAAGDRIKWVEQQNLHVTLNFLGDVADELIADVCAIAEQAAAEVEPFEMFVRGIKAVPPHGRLRMIWAGVDEPTGNLARLRESLSLGLEGLGLRQEERAFRPHITLARIKTVSDADRLRRTAGLFGETDFGSVHVDELVAYASRLGKDGPTYTPIASAVIGG